jgi:hypothetical protein
MLISKRVRTSRTNSEQPRFEEQEDSFWLYSVSYEGPKKEKTTHTHTHTHTNIPACDSEVILLKRQTEAVYVRDDERMKKKNNFLYFSIRIFTIIIISSSSIISPIISKY